MGIIHALTRHVLDLLVPGSGSRRGSPRPTVNAIARAPEASPAAPSSLPAHRSPYGLHPLVDRHGPALPGCRRAEAGVCQAGPDPWPYAELPGLTAAGTAVGEGGAVMADGRRGAAVRGAEIPMLRAYRLWFEHTRTCDGGCTGAAKVQDGCESGRELWGAYRLARIGRSGEAS